MITLKEFLEIVGYRITEGSRYCWECFGPNAYTLDSWTGREVDNEYLMSITFDQRTQVVYTVSAYDYKNDREYRFMNPEFMQAHKDECAARGVGDEAWDEVDYVDLEVKDDWLEKARAIIAGENYDIRVQMPIDFSDAELLQYMKLAHELDLTFNQFVEVALRRAIDEHSLISK